jgi:hypothetical protein
MADFDMLLSELTIEKELLENGVIPDIKARIERLVPSQETKLKECDAMPEKSKDRKECIKRVTVRYKEETKLEERNFRDAIKRVDKIEKELVGLKKKRDTLTKKLKKTGLSVLTQQAQLESRCKILVK